MADEENNDGFEPYEIPDDAPQHQRMFISQLNELRKATQDGQNPLSVKAESMDQLATAEATILTFNFASTVLSLLIQAHPELGSVAQQVGVNANYGLKQIIDSLVERSDGDPRMSPEEWKHRQMLLGETAGSA